MRRFIITAGVVLGLCVPSAGAFTRKSIRRLGQPTSRQENCLLLQAWPGALSAETSRAR